MNAPPYRRVHATKVRRLIGGDVHRSRRSATAPARPKTAPRPCSPELPDEPAAANLADTGDDEEHDRARDCLHIRLWISGLVGIQ